MQQLEFYDNFIGVHDTPEVKALSASVPVDTRQGWRWNTSHPMPDNENRGNLSAPPPPRMFSVLMSIRHAAGSRKSAYLQAGQGRYLPGSLPVRIPPWGQMGMYNTVRETTY